MSGEKTEQPTAKKLHDARKKGQVVKQYIGEPDFDAMHKLLARLLAADAKA